MALSAKKLEKLHQYIKENPETVFKDLADRFDCSVSIARRAYYAVFPGDVPPVTKRATRLHGERSKGRLEKMVKKESARKAMLEHAAANQEATYEALAEAYGLQYHTVKTLCRSAGLHNGDRAPSGVCDRGTSLGDQDYPRAKTIRRAIEEHWTLQELGNALEVTRERARQLKVMYQQKFGEVPTEEICSLGDIADEMGVDRQAVVNVALKLGLVNYRGKKKMYILAKAVDQLKEEVLLSRKVCCPNCGKTRFRAPREKYTLYCSSGCRKDYQYRRSCQRLVEPLTEDNCDEYLPLVKKIKTSDAGCTYIPLKEAKRISGASSMQIVYLRRRQVLRTVPAASGRSRNGKPHVDYSLADIEKLGEFLSNNRT